MVQVNLQNLNDQFFINYFNFLINRVFKILPISENEPDTLKDYLDSLILELKGSQDLILKIKHDASFVSLLAILQYFTENECSHKVIKRETFRAINIIQGLQKKYFEKEEIK